MCMFKKKYSKNSNAVTNQNNDSCASVSGSGMQLNGDEPGFVAGIYYTNWSPYKPRAHYLPEINTDQVSHIYYAFFLVDPKTGKLKSSDTWSDFEKPIDHFKSKLTGGIGTLFQMKTNEFHNKQQSFKSILSVGGWSNREAFPVMVKSKAKMDCFIQSCVDTMFEYGFDGIDLDWEFPEDDGVEPMKYYEIIQGLRRQLDRLETTIFGESSRKFHLSVATPAFEEKLKILPIDKMDKYVDLWNMMTYDYYGEWSEYTGIHCNLYGNPSDKNKDSGLNGDAAIKYMISKYKIPPRKLVLGMVLYGRSFTHVQASISNKSTLPQCIGRKFSGVGGATKDEPGMWPYNRLPLPNSQEVYEPQSGAAFCYNPQTKTMVGYDNIKSVQQKAMYIKDFKLAGTFWWESSGNTWQRETYSLVNEFYLNIPSVRKASFNIYMDDRCRKYYLSKHEGTGFLSNILGGE
ncbi:chitinase 4 [Monosporozyma servazzii]